MVSRRTALQSAGALLGGFSAGCIGQSGPTSDRVEWATTDPGDATPQQWNTLYP